MSGIQHTRTTRRPTTEHGEPAAVAALRPAVFRELPDALRDTVPDRDRGRDAVRGTATAGLERATDAHADRQPVPQRPRTG